MVLDIFLALIGEWVGMTTDRKDRNGVFLYLANGTCRYPHLFCRPRNDESGFLSLTPPPTSWVLSQPPVTRPVLVSANLNISAFFFSEFFFFSRWLF